MKKIEVYSIGICCASVCADNSCTIKEITKELNNEHPTGIKGKWKFSKDQNFKGGQPNPCSCNQNPNIRKHYLFNC